MSSAHDDHGSTPAAWTAVTVILIGMTISGAALWWSHVAAFWLGMAVCVVGAVAGKVLAALGFGQASRAGSTSES